MRITKTTTSKIDGEYIVKAYTTINGKTVRYPEADYFAADKQDAQSTAQAMVNSTETRQKPSFD